MENKVFGLLILLFSLLLIIPQFSKLKYEGHISQYPIQEGERSLGTLSMTIDLNLLSGTKRTKDRLVYEALSENALGEFGDKTEIRNMAYREKFKFFNLLLVEAMGDVVTGNPDF